MKVKFFFLCLSISVFTIISFGFYLSFDQHSVKGYARQIFNFLKSDEELKKLNLKNITSLADKTVVGLQHSLKIKTIDLSSITDVWGWPRFSSPAYIFIMNNNIYIVNYKGNIHSYSELGDYNTEIETNLSHLISAQNYNSRDSKTNEDLSGRLGIKSIAYNAKDNFVYVAYHKSIKSNCYSMAIDRAKFNKNLIFNPYFHGNFCRSNFNAHDSGGRIGFLDENIILTIGGFDINLESSKEDIENLLNPKMEVGAVLSIDASGRSTILSKGHRNQQGLAVVGSNIFVTEQGPMGGDQFMNIKKDDNYGWPYYSYGFDYLYKDIYRRPKNPRYSEPIFYFTPSIAISQLVFYSGDEFPRFKNKFIASTLKSTTLQILSSDDFTNLVQSVEAYPLGHRTRDILVMNDGKLLLTTDDAKLLIISRDFADIPNKKK